MESQRRQNGKLVHGVVSVHVRSGIELGKAQLLSLLKRLVVAHSAIAHFSKYVIGGTVDYTHNHKDIVALQAFLQSTDYRHAAHARSFEIKSDVVLSRNRLQFSPMLGDKFLVCGNHAFAGFKRLCYKGLCRFHPAHKFRYDSDVLVKQNILKLVRHRVFFNACGFKLFKVFVKHLFDADVDAVSGRYFIVIFG